MREVTSAKKKRRRQMKRRRGRTTKLRIMQGKEKSRLGSRVKRGQGSTTMRIVMMRRKKMRGREAAKGRVAKKSSVCQTRKTPAQRTEAVPKGNTRSVLPTSICQMKMSHSEAKGTKRESTRKKSWNCWTAPEETKAKKRNLSKKGETALPTGDPSTTKRIATMLQMRVKTESMEKSRRRITTQKALRRKR